MKLISNELTFLRDKGLMISKKHYWGQVVGSFLSIGSFHNLFIHINIKKLNKSISHDSWPAHLRFSLDIKLSQIPFKLFKPQKNHKTFH